MVGARRRWTEAERTKALLRLQTTGEVQAEGIEFTAEDVAQLVAAAPRVNRRPSFGQARFGEAIFGDGADFGGVIFGDDASFGGASFGKGANFSGANFGKRISFGGATFGEGAQFRVAIFGEEAFLLGANFGGGADFGDAVLEGALLRHACLAGCKLNRVRFDHRTILEGAKLFTFVDESGETRAPWLGDVVWNGVQVSGVADWDRAKEARLGEEGPLRDWPLSPRTWTVKTGIRLWRWAWRRAEVTAPINRDSRLSAAVRAYRQVGVLLEDQGLREVAREFDYRASQLARRQRHGLARLALWALDSCTGYGYRPLRVVITYVGAVALFAFLYWLTGTASWQNALFVSLIAFHGRGSLPTGVVAGRFDLILPATEAMVGLFIEALAVAVIVRRLFRN